MTALSKDVIKELISRVNSSLMYYEKDFVSVKRTPTADKERCTSFEQYIGARFNYECCQIEELVDAILTTDGHVFLCSKIDEPDDLKRKFRTATITLDPTLPENLKDEVLRLIGGTEITFNNVKRKIKFIIR